MACPITLVPYRPCQLGLHPARSRRCTCLTHSRSRIRPCLCLSAATSRRAAPPYSQGSAGLSRAQKFFHSWAIRRLSRIGLGLLSDERQRVAGPSYRELLACPPVCPPNPDECLGHRLGKRPPPLHWPCGCDSIWGLGGWGSREESADRGITRVPLANLPCIRGLLYMRVDILPMSAPDETREFSHSSQRML